MARKKSNSLQFSNYQKSLFNKYDIDESYLQTQKQRRVCLELLEKVDQQEGFDEDKMIKNVANAFRNTVLHKSVASCMTLAALLVTLQNTPVMAKSLSDYNTIKQTTAITQMLEPSEQTNGVYLDKDSLLSQTATQQPIQTSSIHILKGKPIKNDITPLEDNGVLLDADSDIHFYQAPEVKALTVIDTGIENWQAIKDAVKEGEILLLSPQQEPLEVIIAKLRQMGEVDTLNIVSHGDSGTLNFSSGTIDIDTLEQDKAKWQAIGNCISEDGDLQLYGCNVAKGTKGSDFIKKLAELTQADIAASINPTGASTQGGDWELEVAVGDINVSSSGIRLPDQSFTQLLESRTVDFSDLPNINGFNYFPKDGLSFKINGENAVFKDNCSTGSIDSDGAGSVDRVLSATKSNGNNWDNFTSMTIQSNNLIPFTLESWYMQFLGNVGSTANCTIRAYRNDTAGYVGELTVPATYIDMSTQINFSGTGALTHIGSFSYVDKLVITSSAANLKGIVLDDMVLKTPDSNSKIEQANITTAVAVPTTAVSADLAVPVFDFKITDVGGDTLDTSVTTINLLTSGTGVGKFNRLEWVLTGPDIAPSGIVGTYDFMMGRLSFNGLNLSIANGMSETYTVKAYYKYTTNLTDGETYGLTINSGSILRSTTRSSWVGPSAAVVTNTTKVDVVATKLEFQKQPSLTPVSGNAFVQQPVIKAVDAYGNVDKDFNGTVTLTEESAGTLSGTTTVTAVAGIANFSGLSYTATAQDKEQFQLTAAATGLTSAVSNTATADVVATKLVFGTQPTPTSISSGVDTNFTGAPVIKAVNEQGIEDIDYTGTITLSVTDADGSLDGTLNSFTSSGDMDADPITVTKAFNAGEADFSALSIDYTAAGYNDKLMLHAVSAGLTATDSNEITVKNIPVVTSITAPVGTYTSSSPVDLTVTFNITVNVIGTPYIPITLDSGETVQASYMSGTGSNILVFRYTPVAGNVDTNGITLASSIVENGGTLQNLAGESAQLTLNGVNVTGVYVDAIRPTLSAALSADNSYIDVTFSEGVYGANDGNTAVTADKFALNFASNGGTATGVTISSIKKADNTVETSATPLTGGESVIRVFININGVSSGAETIELKPADAMSIFDAFGNAVASTQTTGAKALKDKKAPDKPNTPDLMSSSDSGSNNTDNITSITLPNFTGTAEAGSAVVLYDGATEIGSAIVGASGNWSITLVSPLAQGGHTITAQATDAVGNVSAMSAGLAVTVDTMAPTVVSLTDNDSDDKVKAGDTVSITAVFSEPVANAKLTIANGSVNEAVMTDSGDHTTWNYVWTVPAENGTAAVTVATTDIAGNAYTGADSLSFSMDSTLPTLTAAALSADNSYIDITFSKGVYGANDGSTAVTADKFALNFASNGGAATGVAISSIKKADNTVEATATPLTGGETLIRIFLNISGVSSGTETIELKPASTASLFDAFGNAVALTQTTGAKALKDKKAPDKPNTPDLMSSSDSGSNNTDNITSITLPNFTGTAEAGSAVVLYDGATEIGSAIAGASGNWSITLVSPLAQGVHTITAQATDAVGNVSAMSADLAVTVDTMAPTVVSLTDNDSDDKVKAGDTVSITAVFSEPVANAKLTIANGSVNEAVMIDSGDHTTWNYVWTVPAVDGTATVTVATTDIAGNAYTGADSLSFSMDSSLPMLTAAVLAVDNSYIDVTVSEGVYGANNGSTAVTADKFALNFASNGGAATGVTISSVKKADNIVEAFASSLTGGENIIRVFLNINGVPSGTETIELKPASATSLFDVFGNAVTQTQTTGVKALNDKKSPVIVALSPFDNSTDVNNTSDLTMTFDEAVTVGSGNITIKKATDNAVFEAINVTSAQVTGDGTHTITVNPTLALTQGTEFYVQVDSSALKDAAGNTFAGISDKTAWNFTTVAVSNNANLMALNLSDGTLTFNSATTTYTTSVSNAVYNITVTPTVEDTGKATVKVNGVEVTSGQASTPIALNVGSNTIVITVTAQNGTTKEYTLNVTKEASNTKAITSFKFEQLSSTVTASVYEQLNEIIAIVPWGTDVSALAPTITHTGVSIAPNSGVIQNFNHPVVYTVTAQDQSSQNYTASVVIAQPNALLAPTGVTAQAGDKQVTVNWNKAEAATSYQLFQRTADKAYSGASMTVTDSVYSHTFTGLDNGTMYYFAIKAINGAVESTYSNEVSAIPMTVPNAPTNVVATAGNGQAVVRFNPPVDNGGSAITKYTVISNPGGIVAEGTGSPIIITGLTNEAAYTFTVIASNSNGQSVASAPCAVIIPKAPEPTQPTQPTEPDESSESTTEEDSGSLPEPTQTGIIVIVNGQQQTAGTEKVTTQNGVKTVELKTDAAILNAKIEQVIKENKAAGKTVKNVVEIPVATANATRITSIVTGDTINNMEKNDFALAIKTENIDYIIPAQEIGILQIASKFGVDSTSLQKIEVSVEIEKLQAEQTKEILNNAKKAGYDMVFPPVEFKVVAKIVSASGETKEIEIDKFSSYVTRVMEIPAGIDPTKVTTGIVYNADGTFSHIPTNVFKENGKWYARLNSLTNSSYCVIFNPVTVASVSNHWSKTSVNDMAERLIIDNLATFKPDEAITRGEFAEYITKAVGVYRTGAAKQKKFTDVELTSELADAITIAAQYNIIAGYPDGSFKPEATITRQEAMTMYGAAMDIIHLKAKDSNRIETYADKEKVDQWAYEAVKKTVGSGVFNGTTANTLDPQSTFTYAEAATAIKNLLLEAELIND